MKEKSDYQTYLEREYSPDRIKAMHNQATMPKSITYEKTSLAWARVRRDAEFAAKEMSKDRIDRAKEWLKNENLECFRIRKKTKYTIQRKAIVVKLRKEGLNFEEMEQVLSELSGVSVKKAGLQFIYRR